MENKTLNLNLTIEEVQIIMNSLINEPYRISAQIINKIQTQANEQLNKQNETINK